MRHDVSSDEGSGDEDEKGLGHENGKQTCAIRRDSLGYQKYCQTERDKGAEEVGNDGDQSREPGMRIVGAGSC